MRMNSVTQEQIAAARQVSLLSYLQSREPGELVRVGAHEYATKTHDSLRISENGKWNWCSRGFGGKDALNYLIKVQGMDFVSAVRQLCDFSPVGYTATEQERRFCERSPPQKPFALPTPDKSNAAVLRYLRGRGIGAAVLNFCVQEKMLYQTDRSGFKNCVFVGRDENHAPRYACWRGCGGSYRGDVAGSQKKYGFSIPARKEDASIVEVYEAPIDALSGASLRVLTGRDWRTVHYLALGGLTRCALEHFLQTHPQVKTLQLCLDNDEPGRAFAKKLTDEYSRCGCTVRDLIPPKGKDINEYLQVKLGLLHAHEAER